MNGYNFTERLRKVLSLAHDAASRLHHEYVGTEHLLLGLIVEGEGHAALILQDALINPEEIRDKIEETVRLGKGGNPREIWHPAFTSRSKKVLELAMLEARELNFSYVGTEHLLAGLLREERGVAAQVLTDLGLTYERVRAELQRIALRVREETERVAQERSCEDTYTKLGVFLKENGLTEDLASFLLQNPSGQALAIQFIREVADTAPVGAG